MWLVNLNYNFECDWLIELSDNKLSDNKVSDNKLSDNNLTSELVRNRSFFKPITIEEIVIFMITGSKTDVYREGNHVQCNASCPINVVLRYMSAAKMDTNSSDLLFIN